MTTEPTTNQFAGGLFARLFYPAADEVGAVLAEKVREYKRRNMSKIFPAAEKIAIEAGVTEENAKEIEFGMAVKAIDAASQESNADVQELWAQLLANAIDPRKEIEINKMYISILSELGPLEAQFLKLLYKLHETTHFKTQDEIAEFNLSMNTFADSVWRHFSLKSRQVAIQNLIRLRCITFRPQHADISGLLTPLDERSFGSGSNEFAVINIKKMNVFLQYMANSLSIAGGAVEPDVEKPIPLINAWSMRTMSRAALTLPELNYVFTSLGREFVRVCSSDSANV